VRKHDAFQRIWTFFVIPGIAKVLKFSINRWKYSSAIWAVSLKSLFASSMREARRLPCGNSRIAMFVRPGGVACWCRYCLTGKHVIVSFARSRAAMDLCQHGHSFMTIESTSRYMINAGQLSPRDDELFVNVCANSASQHRFINSRRHILSR
jgi:hypothetical protein